MRNLFLIVFFSLPVFLQAQSNLVPNPSFEDTIKCIQSFGDFNGYVADWFGGSGIGYCTSQCPSLSPQGTGVPQNAAGFQYAHTGVSYACLYSYLCVDSTDTIYSNTRGYIEVQLIAPLNTGTKYFVTFYISLADSFHFACNDMGAYLSDTEIILSNNTHNVLSSLIPQVANNPVTHPLTDVINWMKVTGTYIASGGEQYIVIGNFLNDTDSHVKYVGYTGKTSNNFNEALYYIDDVFVTTDSLLAGEGELKTKNEEVSVYPNPANTLLNVQLKLNEGESANICLYNSIGQLVQCKAINSKLTTLPINTLAEGLYFYRITDNQSNLLKADKQMIIH